MATNPLGTLRYARYYYSYFSREGKADNGVFFRQSQMIKISLYRNGVCSLAKMCVLAKMTSLKKTSDFSLLSCDISLITNGDFLLL